jgi:predicted nuclease of predicted toxin-antitoxin system
MHFLADESCDFRVVRALRAAGHDVHAVIEIAPGADDLVVIAMTLGENRILLTEDSDFGQLVYAAGKPNAGVILLRYPSTVRANLPAFITEIVAKHAETCGTLCSGATGANSNRRGPANKLVSGFDAPY